MGAPALKEAEAWDRTSVTLPTRVWEQLAVELEEFNKGRPKPERYSRDRFMAEGLAWFCEEMKNERAERKGR
jgi:hypothetical protein